MLLRVLVSLFLVSSVCFGFDLLKSMSLEEKVGQLLMVQFYGETINDEAKMLVQDVRVGGIIYYNWSNGLTSPAQVQVLSSDLQKLTKNNPHTIPLLIAADQEGGIVARLESGFTCFPGNSALGETNDLAFAQRAAFAMGQELLAVGINMNLAPVVDVNTNPKNPVIGIRSFGYHPETVVAFGQKALDGFREAGVITTLKHFPGHGDVSIDSHEALPVIHKSKQELEKVELFPFAKLASSADAIMTAHILVPALDSEHCSTLSEKTLTYLREAIGFQGVIVSDSLFMDGVLERCHSVDEASIRALDAGCDLLILGGKLLVGERAGFELSAADIRRVHGSLVSAVKDGRIKEDKLNASVERILKLKARYLNLETPNPTPTDLHTKISIPEHLALAQKIASCALKVTGNESGKITCLGNQKLFIVGPGILQSALTNTSFSKLGKSTGFYFFSSLNPSTSEIETAKVQAQGADVIVVCSYNAWKNPSAVVLTEALLQLNKPIILLALRDSLDAELFPKADLIFKSFSPSIPSLQAICDHLGAL